MNQRARRINAGTYYLALPGSDGFGKLLEDTEKL
jgi:hypothetical protein